MVLLLKITATLVVALGMMSLGFGSGVAGIVRSIAVGKIVVQRRYKIAVGVGQIKSVWENSEKTMFEITIRGMTRQFDTAGEMAEWQESMRSPRPRLKPKKGHKRKLSSLSDKLEAIRGRGRQGNAPDS